MGKWIPASEPTMYFIGVTTAQSSIMKVFPLWAQALGIRGVLKGIDLPIHAPAETFREVAAFIRDDPLSMGALVTTHKLDMYNAAKDIFTYKDPYAVMFGELSSISKKDGLYCAHAKDPISSGLTLASFLPKDHWKNTGAQVCILGAGGSALSMSAYLAAPEHHDNVPSLIHLCNRSPARLEEAKEKLKHSRVPIVYHMTGDDPANNDAVIHSLPASSLVVNATGLGKDRPGSPVSDSCVFPENGIVWELNYRGALNFMHQAGSQQAQRNLQIEDGWTYFIHGWTQVISEVFHIDITGERLAVCDRIARDVRKGRLQA